MLTFFLCLCLTEENTSLLFHPPPPALAVGLLSFPLISLHNLLGTVPQSISSCMENAIFFICFMQITPSNTQSIGEGDKKKIWLHFSVTCVLASCILLTRLSSL